MKEINKLKEEEKILIKISEKAQQEEKLRKD